MQFAPRKGTVAPWVTTISVREDFLFAAQVVECPVQTAVQWPVSAWDGGLIIIIHSSHETWFLIFCLLKIWFTSDTMCIVYCTVLQSVHFAGLLACHGGWWHFCSATDSMMIMTDNTNSVPVSRCPGDPELGRARFARAMTLVMAAREVGFLQLGLQHCSNTNIAHLDSLDTLQELWATVRALIRAVRAQRSSDLPTYTQNIWNNEDILTKHFIVSVYNLVVSISDKWECLL